MSGGWELTDGLRNLRAQVDEAFPDRDKTSDGTIGDTAHQDETSGHNPDDTAGSRPEWDGDSDNDPEVRAWDMDSDLRAAPTTAQALVDHLRALPGLSTVLRYMIYNRVIYEAAAGWAPRAYLGASAHTEHIHFSGARTNAADANQSFDFRLEELPVALTPADKTWLTNMIDARLDATDRAIDSVPERTAAVKIDVNPGGDTPNMQPWARVDAYGSSERKNILTATNKAGAAAERAAVAAASTLAVVSAPTEE